MEPPDVDVMFRPGSKAHAIAMRLVSGEPQPRHELAQEVEVSGTSINRVVDLLQEEGAVIERRTTGDGRRAVFQLKGWGDTAPSMRHPQVGEAAELHSAAVLGDRVQVEVVTQSGRWRGLLQGAQPLRLGEEGVVESVMGDASDIKLRVTMEGGAVLPLELVVPVA